MVERHDMENEVETRWVEVEMPEREERGVIAETLGSVGRAGRLTAPKFLSAPNKTAARVGEEAVWFRGGSEP
jgi:hypothetical protein